MGCILPNQRVYWNHQPLRNARNGIPDWALIERKPRAAAGMLFPGTLKTSLCATRLFPTADYPGRASLRLHAQDCCRKYLFKTADNQAIRLHLGINPKTIFAF